jgi:pimeloyl-ACP methyl ester carboxylesterase
MDTFTGPTSHSYFSQRLRLHYVDWGNPEAPPLLLVHGGRDHCRNWDWVAQALRKDYHIIAPDLRGHGDSQWISGGTYQTMDYVYDLAQLIHQQELAPLRIVSHSMGGNIALRYTGLYPEKVAKLVAIEGLMPSPISEKNEQQNEIARNLRGWVNQLRRLSGRQVRRYDSVQEATDRMKEANPHLSVEQAYHLTFHGVNQNEDGSYSWKFDNYIRAFPSSGLRLEDTNHLLSRISCPTMLVRGSESEAPAPEADGRDKLFQDLRIENVENAGHWVHHDQLERFLDLLRDFL